MKVVYVKFMVACLVTILLLAPVTGCSGEAEDSETVASASNRWLDLLRVLPENEVTLKSVSLQDAAFLREMLDEYGYSPEVPMLRNHDLAGGFNADPGIMMSEGRFDGDEALEREWQETLGFTPADIDRTITAGSAPPAFYEAVQGRFSAENIENAVRTGPMNEMLETASHGGYEYYAWGEDFGINIAMRSNVRPMGRGHRLALVDNYIFWTLWTEGIEEMIDSFRGDISSLADNADYRLLAEALARFDTFNAFFCAESQSREYVADMFPETPDGGSDLAEMLRLGIDLEPFLKPYTAMASGAGLDADSPYLVIALTNPDEAAALENASLLEERINSFRQTPDGPTWAGLAADIEVTVQGRLTVARISSDRLWRTWDMFGSSGTLPFTPLLVSE